MVCVFAGRRAGTRVACCLFLWLYVLLVVDVFMTGRTHRVHAQPVVIVVVVIVDGRRRTRNLPSFDVLVVAVL